MRIALLQLRVTGNKARDIRAAEKAIRSVCAAREPAAAARRCDVVVLPEMWNCPYDNRFFMEYSETTAFSSIEPSAGRLPDAAFRAAALPDASEAGPSCSMMSSLAREYGVTIVGGTIPELVESAPAPGRKRQRRLGEQPRGPASGRWWTSPEPDGAPDLYNTCFVFGTAGQLVGRHRKVHLFDIDIPGRMTFKESDTLTAGDRLLTVVDVPLGAGAGRSARVGVGICYDLRFPVRVPAARSLPAAASRVAGRGRGPDRRRSARRSASRDRRWPCWRRATSGRS